MQWRAPHRNIIYSSVVLSKLGSWKPTFCIGWFKTTASGLRFYDDQNNIKDFNSDITTQL